MKHSEDGILKEENLKAWFADTDRGSLVVFADNENLAQTIVGGLLVLENLNSKIKITRLPDGDKEYRGHFIMRWTDPADRLFMVQKLHYVCEESDFNPTKNCPSCSANEYCEKYCAWRIENDWQFLQPQQTEEDQT